jgi:hypothetical protein
MDSNLKAQPEILPNMLQLMEIAALVPQQDKLIGSNLTAQPEILPNMLQPMEIVG